MSTTVGVIGLGRIGGQLARNLRDGGYEVIGYDVAPKPELAAAGIALVNSPGEVAARADIILHSLVGAKALNEVVAGLIGHINTRHVIADLSTYLLADKQQAAARVAQTGAVMLDCQISGSPEMLTTRDGVIFASGDEAAAALCKPVFEVAVKKQFFVGPFGAATRLKTANNLLVGLNTAAAAEALAIALRGGIDPAIAIEVMSSGAANSRMFVQRAPSMAARNYEGVSGTLSSFAVYLDLIEAALKDYDLDAPLARAAVARYRQAIAQGHSDEDLSYIYEFI